MNESDQFSALAWTIAALQRTKKLPPIKALMHKREQRAQHPLEMQQLLEGLGLKGKRRKRHGR